MKYLRLSILTLILAIALASLTSYNVSALSFGATSSSGWSVGNNTNSGSYIQYTNGVESPYVLMVQNNTDGVSVGVPASSALVGVVLRYKTVPSGKHLLTIPYRVCFGTPDELKSWIGFSSNNYWYLVSNTWEYTSGACITGDVTYYANGGYNNVNLGNSGAIVGATNVGYNMVFGKGSIVLLSDDANYTSVLNSIKNNTDNIKTKLDTLHTDMSDLKSSMNGVAEQEERVADVAEDEYNKTVQDEQTASSGASGFSFNFSLPNPFGIFQVSDGCVSTPTIDSWLHLEGDWKSPHCPIIPANVRNILTPVVTLIVTLATLLVVIRWVSSSAVDVAGNSVAMNDKPQKGGK